MEGESTKIGTSRTTKEETDSKPGLRTYDEVKLSNGNTNTESTQPSDSNGASRAEKASKAEGGNPGEQALDKAADSEELDFMGDSSDDEKQQTSDDNTIELDANGADEMDDLYESGSNEDAQAAQRYVRLALLRH